MNLIEKLELFLGIFVSILVLLNTLSAETNTDKALLLGVGTCLIYLWTNRLKDLQMAEWARKIANKEK